MVLSVGSVLQIAKMKVFAVVLAAVASVSCDPYTIGQVAYGYGHPAGVVTGVDYGHGLVSGVGAIGNRAVYGVHHGYYGKRDAEPWTIGQVAAGLPLHNAALDGRLHNPGVITGVSYGHHGLYYGKREAEAEPYTLGHPHNVGYTAYVSHGLGYGHGLYYGKREAEAEPKPYTLGQVAAGLPVYNAYATGHPHNVGYTAYVSHGLGYGHGLYYGKREAEAEPKPYTLGQVAAGLPIANAYATG